LQRTFEFKTKENEKVKEDVGADVKENYVQYHRQDDDSEVTVIEDFNRVSKLHAFTPIRSSVNENRLFNILREIMINADISVRCISHCT